MNFDGQEYFRYVSDREKVKKFLQSHSIELRGLLEVLIVSVELLRERFGVFRVRVGTYAPDVKTGEWVRIYASRPFFDGNSIRMGMTIEQLAIIETLRSLWDHEFLEGVVVGGSTMGLPHSEDGLS